MGVTISQLQELVQGDYQQLCRAVPGVTPVPLDVYEIIHGSQELTPHGMPRHYPYAGYDQRVIHLPFHALELDLFPDTPPPFLPQPQQWGMGFNQIWPKWRCDLWHEVIHQYVDQVLNQWTPDNRHDGPWFPATHQLADALAVPTRLVQNIAWGVAVPLIGGGNRAGT